MNLVLKLLGDMCFSAVIAYLLGRNRRIMQLAVNPRSKTAWLFFTVVFSALSIISSYYGVRINGALASTRIVGTLMGGLIGGPYAGFSVGLISGIHRYFLGGFTAPSCAIATFIAGWAAGLLRDRLGFPNLNWRIAAVIALGAEVLQKGLTLAFAKPFAAALAFEQTAALPTIAVTILGTSLFVLILNDMRIQYELEGARAAQLALSIADETLPHLRQGLNANSAQKVAEIIKKLTSADAVSITDRENILAFLGLGHDHHQNGHSILSDSTQKALKTKEPVVFFDGPHCPVPGCPLVCGIVAPFVINKQAVGCLKFYKTKNHMLSEPEIETVRGLARLLASQLALAEVDRQQALRKQADFKALQAQINPHFLFNTLSIIMSFCRTAPETARELLTELSEMLHFNFAKHEDKIPVQEEFNSIKAYLNIAKARFGSRLTLHAVLEPTVADALIPAFSLQPLVENALNHGLSYKPTDCRLDLDIQNVQDRLVITLADNGIGMTSEQQAKLLQGASHGIGFANVYQRLQSLYPGQQPLQLVSAANAGTTITINLPLERRADHGN